MAPPGPASSCWMCASVPVRWIWSKRDNWNLSTVRSICDGAAVAGVHVYGRGGRRRSTNSVMQRHAEAHIRVVDEEDADEG